MFHPDNFTFGQTVYAKSAFAAAQAVDGVASVEITVFQRERSRMIRNRCRMDFCRWADWKSRVATTIQILPSTACFVLTVGGGK